jgi:hypothetical protein
VVAFFVYIRQGLAMTQGQYAKNGTIGKIYRSLTSPLPTGR